jgi:hypothetical protein
VRCLPHRPARDLVYSTDSVRATAFWMVSSLAQTGTV